MSVRKAHSKTCLYICDLFCMGKPYHWTTWRLIWEMLCPRRIFDVKVCPPPLASLFVHSDYPDGSARDLKRQSSPVKRWAFFTHGGVWTYSCQTPMRALCVRSLFFAFSLLFFFLHTHFLMVSPTPVFVYWCTYPVFTLYYSLLPISPPSRTKKVVLEKWWKETNPRTFGRTFGET